MLRLSMCNQGGITMINTEKPKLSQNNNNSVPDSKSITDLVLRAFTGRMEGTEYTDSSLFKITQPLILGKRHINHSLAYSELGSKYQKEDTMYFAGICYLNGLGIIRKNLKLAEHCFSEAFKIFKLLADQGDSAGQNNVGICYQCGQGVEVNKKEAFKYYKLSAKQGNLDGQNNLGQCYQYGIGVNKSKWKPAKYYKLSAKQGHAGGQNNLGWCYEHDFGVDMNSLKAFKYYKMSADQGHAGGQNNLGECYENGFGVDKDKKEAFKYYKLSAKQGHAAGQGNLARCYYHGIGVDKNEWKSNKYLLLLRKQGRDIDEVRARYRQSKVYAWRY